MTEAREGKKGSQWNCGHLWAYNSVNINNGNWSVKQKNIKNLQIYVAEISYQKNEMKKNPSGVQWAGLKSFTFHLVLHIFSRLTGTNGKQWKWSESCLTISESTLSLKVDSSFNFQQSGLKSWTWKQNSVELIIKIKVLKPICANEILLPSRETTLLLLLSSFDPFCAVFVFLFHDPAKPTTQVLLQTGEDCITYGPGQNVFFN